MQPRNEYLEEKNCKNNNFSGVLPPSRTHTLKKDVHFKSSDMKNQRMPHLMPISGSDINRTFYSPYFTLHSPHYNSLCSILVHFNIAIGFGQRLFRALMIQRRGFASTSLSEKESFRFETKLESCSPESGPEWQGRVVKLSSGKGGGEGEEGETWFDRGHEVHHTDSCQSIETTQQQQQDLGSAAAPLASQHWNQQYYHSSILMQGYWH